MATVHLKYSQVISSLHAIHGLEQGIRVYEDGKFHIRRYSIGPAFRFLMAEAKVKLSQAHQVIDAYHQGLAPTFINPETRQPYEESIEHYTYLWHQAMNDYADPFTVRVCPNEEIPDMPFVMRGYLLPLFGAYPISDYSHEVHIPASKLESSIDAIHALEGKVVDGEDSAGIVTADYPIETQWDLAHTSARLQEALAALLQEKNNIRGMHRDVDFLLPAEHAAEVQKADNELMASVVTITGIPQLHIPAAALELIDPPADLQALLDPFLAPSHV